jgi:hypothetical protein
MNSRRNHLRCGELTSPVPGVPSYPICIDIRNQSIFVRHQSFFVNIEVDFHFDLNNLDLGVDSGTVTKFFCHWDQNSSHFI